MMEDMTNVVILTLDKYEKLLFDSFELEQARSIQENLISYNERIENAIIPWIAKEIGYGKYTWKINDEPHIKNLISVLNLHECDWSKYRPEEEKKGEEE